MYGTILIMIYYKKREYRGRKILVQKVVAIEYFENEPHSIITDNGVFSFWDCFYERGHKDELKYFCSGGGGTKKTFKLETSFVNPNLWSIWVAKGYRHILNVQEGVKILEHPIFLSDGWETTSYNPSKIGTEAYDQNYCKVCEEFSEEYCFEHIYEDDDGNLRYVESNEIVN